MTKIVGCKKKTRRKEKNFKKCRLSNHLACKQIVSSKFSNPEENDILRQRKNVNVHYEISKTSSKGKIQSIFCPRRTGRKQQILNF